MPINYPYHSQSTKGMPGASGRPGNGIADVIKINTVGLVDTYRILFTNGTYTDFDITNGVVGTNGTNGVDGNGIVSVTPFSTVGLVKTYRILFDDATTFDYTVTDGADGAGSGDMLKLDNLSGLANYTTARTNLGLGSLATQSGTFSDKEDVANKSISITTDLASNTKYPSVKSVYDWATGLFATISNLALKANIASPTFTGTVGGITAAMVGAPSGSGTSSGSNTGDNATNTQYSGLAASKQDVSAKDATGGYAGLTLFKINFKNAANTFTNFFTNATTAARTYTFPDKDITVAGLVDITGTNSGTNTGDNATNTTYTTLATTIATANSWSAVQTFLAGMMGLRNVANTFTSFFTNVATASRTWTLPDANTIVPIISQILTFSGPTAARTITLPDANFTVARTDAANTFTGVQTMTSPVFTTPVLGTPTSGVATNLTGTATGLTAGDSTKVGGITITGTPSVGQVPTATSSSAATWQTPAAGGSFKGCRVKQSTTQSVGTTLVAIAFDAETFDTDTMHDNVTNNTRITFTTAGYYQISGVLNTDANAVTQSGIRLNGTTYIYLSSVGNAGASLANGNTFSTIYQFSAADYIELMGYFGTTQNTKTGENGTHLAVARLG